MENRIIKYYAGELDEDERIALLKEAFANQELKKQMMEYQHLQSLMRLHPQEKNIFLGKQKLRVFLQTHRSGKEKRIIPALLRYAAIILLCISSTWWITYSWVSMRNPQEITQRLSVPKGQRAHISLPDGSKVWVNSESTLTYPSVFDKERRVQLTGEAFFEVAKGSIPFIVSTGKVDVKALGTQFNICNYPKKRLLVSLLEGSVQVYQPHLEKDGIVLKPNQQLYEKEKGFGVRYFTDNPTEWKGGLFVFNQQKLKEIINTIELYYDVDIAVQDSSILEYEYTGKIRQQDGVIEALHVIGKIHSFKIKRTENQKEIILYR